MLGFNSRISYPVVFDLGRDCRWACEFHRRDRVMAPRSSVYPAWDLWSRVISILQARRSWRMHVTLWVVGQKPDGRFGSPAYPSPSVCRDGRTLRIRSVRCYWARSLLLPVTSICDRLYRSRHWFWDSLIAVFPKCNNVKKIERKLFYFLRRNGRSQSLYQTVTPRDQ